VAHAAEPQQRAGDISSRVFNSTPISIQQGTLGEWTTLKFDSERWDTANLHGTATNSNRLKAPMAGKYYIYANVVWETPIGAGLCALRIQVNGKTVIAEQSAPNTGAPYSIALSLGTHYALSAGDYVEAQVFQNTGGAMAVLRINAAPPEFGMVKVP
jgi:hypothetical protein